MINIYTYSTYNAYMLKKYNFRWISFSINMRKNVKPKSAVTKITILMDIFMLRRGYLIKHTRIIIYS